MKSINIIKLKHKHGVHKISKEGKLRISIANKGKVISEQQKEKIRKAALNNDNYGMKNKHHTQLSKNKMRQRKLGVYNGVNNPNYKYSIEFANTLKTEYNDVKCYAELGRRYNLSASTISYIINRNF